MLEESTPWCSLPENSLFLLPDDQRVLEEFNQNNKYRNTRIRTCMLPDPFAGSRNAPVFILLDNLGAEGGEEDVALHRELSHRTPPLRVDDADTYFHVRKLAGLEATHAVISLHDHRRHAGPHYWSTISTVTGPRARDMHASR